MEIARKLRLPREDDSRRPKRNVSDDEFHNRAEAKEKKFTARPLLSPASPHFNNTDANSW